MGERLKNKVAIVTGAGSVGPGCGNGKATAVLFAREGAKIFALDINLSAAEETKSIIEQEGGACNVMKVDVSRSDEVKSMVDQCLKTYGRIDILHNNVGIVLVGGLEETTEETWDRVMAVNLKSIFLTCKYTIPHMVRQGGGVIINICSTYGLVGPDQRIYQREGHPPQFKPVYYSVTKAGVLGLTRYLATYYAGKNIRANALTPGGVYNNHDEVFVQNYAYRTVMGRMADQDEMNGALLFLASDASSYMTGANLVVDGGWTAW